MMRKRSFLQLVPVSFLLAHGVSWAATATDTAIAPVLTHYGNLVLATYEDTLAGALELQSAIAAFIAAPSVDTLQSARKNWLTARESYGQTEAFRFYGGPIDDDQGPEGRLNAWPMDEAYVDYVEGKPNAGLINNRKLTINKHYLKRMNERGGEENIATGWHAIEFLLWGQDLDENGAGNRSHEDYVDGKRANADRRRLYLTTVTTVLVDDLRMLVGAWKTDAANYRSQFEKGGKESVRKIIIGLGSLSRGELAGERMEVALNTQDQEDEHSCFSDNTHRDIVNNALGIENVWLGRLLRRDGSQLTGVSLHDLVAAKDGPLAEQVTVRMAASVAAARAIEPPFDREIIGGMDAPGRQRVKATIDNLVQQSKDLTQAAAALGITRLNQATAG